MVTYIARKGRSQHHSLLVSEDSYHLVHVLTFFKTVNICDVIQSAAIFSRLMMITHREQRQYRFPPEISGGR